jgi:hypothetical protein
MGLRFLKIAVVYLVIGALLGLGWGSRNRSSSRRCTRTCCCSAGRRWRSRASCTTSIRSGGHALARFHFWMHNAGLPVFMLGLGLVLSGREWALPITVVGAVTVLLGLVLFAANVLVNIKSPAVAA